MTAPVALTGTGRHAIQYDELPTNQRPSEGDRWRGRGQSHAHAHIFPVRQRTRADDRSCDSRKGITRVRCSWAHFHHKCLSLSRTLTCFAIKLFIARHEVKSSVGIALCAYMLMSAEFRSTQEKKALVLKAFRDSRMQYLI